ncbi:hypothetical protein MSAS_05090 [Mycobacterium saskatchewanense]|uniref:Uncharacterized protein n=1 Tax=Mycobacterium saskatchewanense TaxID=220927 RepID=A0AAJ3NPF5_9MYCO|nr:hypothetical protein [Mycobacterium saskatchewanense]ORW70178.1 hypothetical protein AWC23_18580 [Mycobacterium saskatchewanense]BBX61335.1 hypothetical protein MSAS_05090 [Mycobacterium saskatchewanense]
MTTAEDPQPRFLVEWYGLQGAAQSIGAIADRLNEHATSLSTCGRQVRLLAAMAVPADDYVFGVFTAESAEIVAQLCGDAGAPAERISTAVGWVQAQDS